MASMKSPNERIAHLERVVAALTAGVTQQGQVLESMMENVFTRSICIRDSAGTPRLTLDLDDDDDPRIVMRSRDGAASVLITTTTGSGGGLAICDGKGAPVALIEARPEGGAVMVLIDPAGERHVVDVSNDD